MLSFPNTKNAYKDVKQLSVTKKEGKVNQY